jgi:hypothetical protein
MRSRLLAWTATVVLLSLTGTGTAMADDVASGQAVGQTAASEQTADAGASSTQVQPTNQNISVRVLSPGDNGAVTQTNTSAADAVAANDNATQQAASQDAAGAGTQAIGQEAGSTQAADADAQSEQIKPTNQNISVRVLSEGDDGSVEQDNTSSAAALAANANRTAQKADQDGGDDGGIQAVAQKAKSEQEADADATSAQDHPSNVNAPVRVLSEGDGGDVEQANRSTATSAALNDNDTLQKAAQDQGDGSAEKGEREYGCGCGSQHGAAVQAIGQKADNRQQADADAESEQVGAKNLNAPVRVHSDGDDGDVRQTNDSAADAVAANENATGQFAQQAQGDHGYGGVGIQAIGQLAKSDQDAEADAVSEQIGAKNVNAPVRVSSDGDGGDVDQRNSSFAQAPALNENATEQVASQEMGDGSGPVAIQAIGQAALNRQYADADATSVQLRPANVNAPVHVGHGTRDEHGHGEKDGKAPARHEDGNASHAAGHDAPKGGEGSAEQANDSAAFAAGLNRNWTGQHAFAV